MNFEAFTVVWLRITVFWVVALCHCVTSCLCCEGKHCLHYQGLNALWRIPLQRWEPPAQQHSITSQKTGILNLYFIHLRYFLITRCWSDWYCIPGIRNCSGCIGLCHWVCCQTKYLWVSHPQTPSYTGYVYVDVTHVLCWNCKWRSLWLLQSDLILLRLHCCSLIPFDFSPNFIIKL